jgi:hypothetical protein
MVRVFYINHGYYSGREYTSLAAALEFTKVGSAEVAFHQGGTVLASWSPIGGLRIHAVYSPVVVALLYSLAARR